MARNRYVVEITYKRAKEWRLLKEVIEVEDFYLMNAVWLWSMGFSNLCHEFLQPPPDVETQAQRARRLDRRAEKEQAAGRVAQEELREAAAAAATAAGAATAP